MKSLIRARPELNGRAIQTLVHHKDYQYYCTCGSHAIRAAKARAEGVPFEDFAKANVGKIPITTEDIDTFRRAYNAMGQVSYQKHMRPLREAYRHPGDNRTFNQFSKEEKAVVTEKLRDKAYRAAYQEVLENNKVNDTLISKIDKFITCMTAWCPTTGCATCVQSIEWSKLGTSSSNAMNSKFYLRIFI